MAVRSRAQSGTAAVIRRMGTHTVPIKMPLHREAAPFFAVVCALCFMALMIIGPYFCIKAVLQPDGDFHI